MTDPGARLAEVFDVLGPLYRRGVRAVEREGGMPVGVRAVLDALAGCGATTVPALGRTFALSRQFVQRSVDDATGRGWVRTRENPAHRRSVLVELTASGEQVLADVRDGERRELAAAGADLDPADLDACLRVLRTLSARLLDHPL
ncbi:MarR family winged helix-turn-helix transcriptional regulator [Actinomycetospora sp. NBRC 106375]|uniref:MarR family winged helix-turn-helix transcriptional regulator n=1 Tax=Actinomycetospora sp. NBRC 106375 TaxID=3032207 RepID=UPI0025524DFC|nr:MarR family winged helix-turn-helix transcriptional regulator [Actinomycetospora sp. NBRC 106375]